jgi:hypothetical protein
MNNAMITLQKAVATCYNVKQELVNVEYIENNKDFMKVTVDMRKCKSPVVCSNGFMNNDKYENGIFTFDFMKKDLYDFLIMVD